MHRYFVPLLLMPLLPLMAQQPGNNQRSPFIRVNGDATVSAKPDQAEINVGVVTQAATAEQAGAQNARQATTVISSLRQVLGQNADIKTINYSLTPLQKYPKEGGPPTITGYSASNTVHVKTQDLGSVGKIIDATTKSGANTIQGIQFTVHDEQAARNQALRQAAQQAKATGEALASALGLRVLRVLSVETGQPSPIRPFAAMEMARVAAAPPTPVEPGGVDVHANVVLTLEVAP